MELLTIIKIVISKYEGDDYKDDTTQPKRNTGENCITNRYESDDSRPTEESETSRILTSATVARPAAWSTEYGGGCDGTVGEGPSSDIDAS